MFGGRLRSRTSPLAFLGRLVGLAFALALIWYGLILVGLALNVIGRGTADLISGYRTAFDAVADLQPSDIGTTTRLVVAGAGLLAFLLFGYLALKELPRPYLSRGEVDLEDGDRGSVRVDPGAVEKLAEGIARRNDGVTDANGRYGGEDLEVLVRVRRARDVADTLRDVQQRVAVGLEEHGLPSVPVNVTLSGFDRQQQRELN